MMGRRENAGVRADRDRYIYIYIHMESMVEYIRDIDLHLFTPSSWASNISPAWR
jgi:hypothetical protein